MTFLFLHPPSSSPSIKTLLHPLHLYLLTENITQNSIQYIKSKPDMNTTRGILFIAVLLITTLALSILARPESFDDSLYATGPPKNFKGGGGGVGGTKGGSTSKGNNNNNNNNNKGGGGDDDGGRVGGYFGPGGGFGIPGFGNGWGSNGGGISGGYGGGYGGPGGGYSKGGIIRPTVECKERGPCYKKKLRCPAKCFTSYSRSGKNYGSGGGGGGCTMDCKKKCIAYC